MSTEVMRVAAFNFIQMSAHTESDPTMLRLRFGLLLSGLMGNEINNVEFTRLHVTVA